MNLNKSREFFDPAEHDITVHIIGCGAIGSTLAENLARFGIEKFHLWDFDIVEPHNIANQMFTEEHVKRKKNECVAEIIKTINPAANCVLHGKCDKTNVLNLKGEVFLAVDSIDIRRELTEFMRYNKEINTVYDTRMGLTNGQLYAADWKDDKAKEYLLSTMQFTHEEAKAETPVSACGFELSVCPTVRVICGYQVANCVNKLLGKHYFKMGLCDPFEGFVDFYEA